MISKLLKYAQNSGAVLPFLPSHAQACIIYRPVYESMWTDLTVLLTEVPYSL